MELSEEAWRDSLTHIHTSSLCLRHGLIQFKVLHRLHYSRDKLAKIFSSQILAARDAAIVQLQCNIGFGHAPLLTVTESIFLKCSLIFANRL